MISNGKAAAALAFRSGDKNGLPIPFEKFVIEHLVKIVTCLILACATWISAWADPGFYPADAKEIPSEVATAAAKVLKIYRVAARPLAIIAAEEIPLLEKLLRGDPTRILERLNVGDPSVVDLWLHDLKTWDRTKDFPLSIGTVGSAFVISPGVLVTARHFFQAEKANKRFTHALSVAEARQNLIGPGERILLRNAAGKFLVDTHDTPNVFSEVKFSGHSREAERLGPQYRGIESSSLSLMLDFVAIEVKHFETGPYLLDLAKSHPAPGSPVFAAGYPLPTTGRQPEKALNSDGKSLRISSGSILFEAPRAYQEFLRGLPGNDAGRGLYLDSLALTNLDFHSGLSGGPILNRDGEVVSLASTVRHDPGLPTSERFSVAVSFGPNLSVLHLLKDSGAN